MFKSLAFFIGLRYTRAKRDNHFISFISLISMAGISLGVMALIVVLSVFNGSQGLMRDRTLITVPHADVYRDAKFADWTQIRNQLLAFPGIIGVAPYLTNESMLSNSGYHHVAEIKGIDPMSEMTVSSVHQTFLQGSLDELKSGAQGIVLARELANRLRLNTGDSLQLFTPYVSGPNSILRANNQSFTVFGIFDVRFSVGGNLAYIHIDDAAKLSKLDSIADAVHLRVQVDDIDQAKAIVDQAMASIGGDYKSIDWSTAESSLFSALRLERLMTSFMLMLIVAIGAFNIISTLIMVVNDKHGDIAILRTMGASKATIMTVFMVQGSAIGILGTLLGAVIGIVLSLNYSALMGAIERFFAQDFAPSDIYVISSLPSRLDYGDVALVCACALIISFLATIYPSYKASQILPADVLRYE